MHYLVAATIASLSLSTVACSGDLGASQDTPETSSLPDGSPSGDAASAPDGATTTDAATDTGAGADRDSGAGADASHSDADAAEAADAATPGCTAEGMISVGVSLLGIHGRPNKVSSWYAVQTGDPSMANADWCDMTISYEAAHSGCLKQVGGLFAYCPYQATWFSSHGEWHAYYSGIMSAMKPGDVVMFDWSGGHKSHDHVGLVEKNNGDGTITTLEGDEGTATVSGGQMARMVRGAAYITGYGRPKYGP